jgi:hypothetical protein
MYIDDVDFHSLSEAEQRRLVRNKKVAATDRLANEIPDDNTAVRVFEKSFDQLVLDRLEDGQYTTQELAEYFSVQSKDARRIVHKYRSRRSDNFVSEDFKLNLLEDRHGVIRAVDNDGRSYYYTLEKIPFFARVIDPTLVFSLLDTDNQLGEFPHVIERIPGGKATELDEDYAFVMGEYWNIDPEEIFDYLTEFTRSYIDTSLLPMPYIEKKEKYNQVANRFRQIDGVYEKMHRVTPRSVQELGETFSTKVEKDRAGITAYQSISIDLADFRWHANQTDDYDLNRAVNEWINRLMELLHPKRSPAPAEESEEEVDINLRDEIQLVLSDTSQTSEEVYEELPRDVQMATSQSEVTEVLETLARIDIIDKQERDLTVKFSLR